LQLYPDVLSIRLEEQSFINSTVYPKTGNSNNVPISQGKSDGWRSKADSETLQEK
jgi:hypothetical protein